MIGDVVAEEMRSKAVAAAEAVYRLSQPEGFDPALRFELRKYATRILSRLAGFAVIPESRNDNGSSEFLADIAGIKELVSFAFSRGFIASNNADLVLGAYAYISKSIGEFRSGRNSNSETRRSLHIENEAASAEITGNDINDRQGRILEYIASRGHAQIGDIRNLFNESCSEKTLQRDLWQLVSSGLIRRKGGNRWTVYLLSKRVGRFMKNNVR